MGDWLVWGGPTSSLGLICQGFAGLAGSFGLVPGVFLGPTVTLDTECVVLPFLLVIVTSVPARISVTVPGVG